MARCPIVPLADVVVAGAGLGGLVSALALAERGARVQLVARGHAATHWTSGAFDIGVVAGCATPRASVRSLQAVPGHPYAFLAGDIPEALDWLLHRLSSQGLPYAGGMDMPIRATPTAMGRTRPSAVVPDAQAAGLTEWGAGERAVVCGPAGYKDLWPDAVAAGLRRSGVWRGTGNPTDVVALRVDLPGIGERHNLDALRLARLFDDPVWRRRALEAIARALDARRFQGPGRIALPAVLGLDDHAAVLAEARARLPLAPFELPMVPPSLPGLRLYRALRNALISAGGRLQVGEAVTRVERVSGRLSSVSISGATRETRFRTGALVLATGGIAGGGIVAGDDGRLRETVLDLTVEAPPGRSWLAVDPFDPVGHPLEAAGVRTDDELRPVSPDGSFTGPRDVRIAGSMLAGQRYLRERCGDGVAIASGWRAASRLATELPAPAADVIAGAGPGRPAHRV